MCEKKEFLIYKVNYLLCFMQQRIPATIMITMITTAETDAKIIGNGDDGGALGSPEDN